ncbi:hypothetical protein V6B08_03705 [Ferrovibrio sp. MS7]|uniref:hypothetical protein n=1 Tax=Ferrovibrio plantarum TaxID=3119164 RepID=UPI0031353221
MPTQPHASPLTTALAATLVLGIALLLGVPQATQAQQTQAQQASPPAPASTAGPAAQANASAKSGASDDAIYDFLSVALPALDTWHGNLKAQAEHDAQSLAAQRQRNLLLGLLLAVLLAGLALGGWFAARLLQQRQAATAASIREAQAARAAATRENRAYLVVEPAGLSNFGAYMVVAGQFSITNQGRSPALRLRQSAALKVLPQPLPDDQPFPAPEDWPNPAQPLPSLGPGISLRSQAPGGPFPPDMLGALIEGQQNRLYLIGSIAYEDVHGTAHETRFCHVLRFDNAADLARAIRAEQAVNYTANFDRLAHFDEEN